MITSTVWSEVGLNNGTREKVVDLVYTDSIGTQSGALTEVVVVQFWVLYAHVVPFITGFPDTVAIPTNQPEWLDNGKTLINK